ncbi:MAG: hypothetical protein ACRDJN_32290, partial [Chloroflexota bacterium]
MDGTVPRAVQPEDLLAIKTVADAQLSPDGSRVAYVLNEIDAEADGLRTSIWIAGATPDGTTTAGDAAGPKRFTRGPKRDSAPRWSPDGHYLAFLSDRASAQDDGPAQLYVMPADGGEARKLTSLDKGAGPAVWSPDGRRILFASQSHKESPPEDEAARARWDQRPRGITRAQYKGDGQGYIFDAVSHLFVIPFEAGGATVEAEAKQITFGDGEDRAPAWSPDGRQIAFSRTRSGAADYTLSDIWVADAAGGSLRRITETIGRATSPAWSPDGQKIACYGTDRQEPGFGESQIRVWTVAAGGGEPRRLAPEDDRSAVSLAAPQVTPGPVWSPDGTALTFVVSDAGNAHVVRAGLDDPVMQTIVGGERQITSASAVPAPGRIAFTATEPSDPGHLYVCAWNGSEERRLTRVNETLLAGLAWPRIERRMFDSPHGGTIDGWLTHPVANPGNAASGTGPAPLLVQIHGGPHSFAGNAFQFGAFFGYVLA